MSPENPNPASGNQVPAPYKFRALKVHASDEWLADGTKNTGWCTTATKPPLCG